MPDPPEPTMPRPGRRGSLVDLPPYPVEHAVMLAGDAKHRRPSVALKSRSGRQTWVWDEESRLGGHCFEPLRLMTEDEAIAVAMALRGLGWRDAT